MWMDTSTGPRRPGRAAAGLGLCLAAGLALTGCGLGTPAELLEGGDAAPAPDAAARSDAAALVDGASLADAATLVDAGGTDGPPTDIPPLDQTTWDSTATATFALG